MRAMALVQTAVVVFPSGQCTRPALTIRLRGNAAVNQTVSGTEQPTDVFRIKPSWMRAPPRQQKMSVINFQTVTSRSNVTRIQLFQELVTAVHIAPSLRRQSMHLQRMNKI
jgi:hypothetical protein